MPSAFELADRLEHLLQLPLTGPADVEPWTDTCIETQTWLNAHADKLPFEMPKFLMFYFHDPDIRAKEPEYKAHQERDIQRLIRQLRGEEAPPPRLPWWHFW